MTETIFYGVARCKRCGNGFCLPDVESRQKCLERVIKCPRCGELMEVEE